MAEDALPAGVLPYPLPPWEHQFKTLSVFCRAEEARIARFIPAPLRLVSNTLQITVMRFDSTVPARPYFDSAVIAHVAYGETTGGYWAFGYTSTDEVLSGTREIWGYRMKLAERMVLVEGEGRISGFTERLGTRLITLDMCVTGKRFEVPDTFPRLHLKTIPHADRPAAALTTIVTMDYDADVGVNLTGEGTVRLEGSAQDPLDELGPLDAIGASFVAGHQVLPWGREIG